MGTRCTGAVLSARIISNCPGVPPENPSIVSGAVFMKKRKLINPCGTGKSTCDPLALEISCTLRSAAGVMMLSAVQIVTPPAFFSTCL